VEHIPSHTLFLSTSITSQSVITDRSNELYYNHTNSPSLRFQYNHNPSVHGQQLSAKLPKSFIHIIQNVSVHNQDTSPFTLTYAFHYNSLSYFLQTSLHFHPSTIQGLTLSLSSHNITNGNTPFCFPGCQHIF